jgi:hypothetical protein
VRLIHRIRDDIERHVGKLIIEEYGVANQKKWCALKAHFYKQEDKLDDPW